MNVFLRMILAYQIFTNGFKLKNNRTWHHAAFLLAQRRKRTLASLALLLIIEGSFLVRLVSSCLVVYLPINAVLI